MVAIDLELRKLSLAPCPRGAMKRCYIAVLLFICLTFAASCTVRPATQSIDLPATVVPLSRFRKELAFCAQTSKEQNWQVYFYAGHLGTLLITQDLWLEQDNGCTSYEPDGFAVLGLTWSPDGTQLAFATGKAYTETFVTNLGEDGYPQKARFLWSIMEGFWDPANLQWSPKGDKIAFVAEARAITEEPVIGYQNIYTLRVDGTELTQITFVKQFPTYVREPVWSPNGAWIAFGLWGDKNGAGVARADGSWVHYIEVPPAVSFDINRVRTSALTSPSISWFPDSSTFVFVARPSTLYRVNRDGSDLRRLVDKGVYSAVVSPDGTRIAFATYDDATRRSSGAIVLIDPQGRERQELLRLEASPGGQLLIRDLAWSPDGDYLAFATNPYGNMDLFLVAMEDGSLYRLTDWPGDEIAPRWRPHLRRRR